MKIKEARQFYRTQINAYNNQQIKLGKQKAELDEKIKQTENGSVVFANEAAILELSQKAITEKKNEYQTYIEQLVEQWNNEFNLVATKQNVEAEKEGFEEMSKVITVARRMMHGDIVPGYDEKKLMEFDDKLYQMAKNAQVMAQLRERKEYESLWEDEDKPELEDPAEVADGKEAFSSGPEVVSVEDTMASVANPEVVE